MPITKSKEDTWKSSELHEHLKSVRFKEATKVKTSMNKSANVKSSHENKVTEDDHKRKSKRKEAGDDNDASKGRDGKSKERDRIKDKEKGGDAGRDKHKDRDKNRDDHKDKDTHTSRDKDRDIKKDGEGTKTRDKETDKERDKERDKGRDKERYKERDKERDKERYKERDKERYKERDKERYKERDDKGKEKQNHKQRDIDGDKHREDRHRDRDKDQIRDREKDKGRNRQRDNESDRKTERDRDKQRQSERHKDSDIDLEKMKEKKRDKGEHKSSRHRSSKHGGDDDSKKKDKKKHETNEQQPANKESKQEKINENDDGDDGDEYEYEDDFEVYEDDFEDEDTPNDDGGGDDDDDSSDNNYQRDNKHSKKQSSDKSKHHHHHNKNKVDDDDDDDGRDDDDINVKEETKRQSKGHEEVKKIDGRKEDGKKEGGLNDLMKAVEEENERLLNRSDIFKRSHHNEDMPRERNLFPSFMINFSKEKTSKVSNRMRERAKEVLRLVELDQKVIDLFTLNPATEYEVFIQRFGNSGYTQAYVQTGDDDVDCELQTEDIVMKDVSTQQPMEFSMKKNNPDDTASDALVDFIDANSLGRFLSKSVPVVIELMEDSRMKTFFKSSNHKPSNIPFADSILGFEIPEILKGRPVTYCHFSDNYQNWFLTIHAPPSKIESKEDWVLRGAICIWNISDLSSPFKILVCQADPACCCFSPFQTSLVFAGMTDGTLLLWDLSVTSYSTMVRSDLLQDFDRLLRQPSFNNALLTTTNHRSPVVSIATLDPSKIGIGEKCTNRRDDLDFQVVTLEMNSVVHLWIPVVVSADKGLDLDIGLSPGANIKLIQSSIINLTSPRKSFGAPSYLSIQLAALPSNHSHLFISTNTGKVVHAMKNRSEAHPACYQSSIDYVSEVSSMDVSKFDPTLILTGHSDGSLRLFEINSSNPIYEWVDSTGYQPIIGVSWLKSRPSCFLVADDNNTIHMWDLCSNQDQPISSHNWSSKSRLSCIKTTEIKASSETKDPTSTNMVAVFTLDGLCELHTIKDTFTKWSTKDEEKWKNVLGFSNC